jgi:hypothetical protein
VAVDCICKSRLGLAAGDRIRLKAKDGGRGPWWELIEEMGIERRVGIVSRLVRRVVERMMFKGDIDRPVTAEEKENGGSCIGPVMIESYSIMPAVPSVPRDLRF